MGLDGIAGRNLLGRLAVRRSRDDRAAMNDNVQRSSVENPGREGRSRTDLALSDGGGGKPRLTGRPGGQFGK